MKLFKRTELDKATGERKTVSNMWHYRFEYKGQVYSASTRLSNYQQAVKVATAKRNEVVLRDTGVLPKVVDVPTVNDFTKKFLDYQHGRVAARSWRFYVDAWKHLLEFPALAGARLDGVTAAILHDFVQHLSGKGLGNASINHSLAAIRRALKIAEELGIIQKMPCKVRMLKESRGRDYVITEETLQRFLKLCRPFGQPEPERDWREARTMLEPIMGAVLPVAYDTGLRAGELVRLEWRDVNLEGRGSVHVRFGKSKQAERFVPLSKRAHAVLTDLQKRRPKDSPSPFVFTRHDGKDPLTVNWLSVRFCWARRKLELPVGCVFHSLRHSAASALGRNGVDAFTLQRLFGWATLSMATRYTHPSASGLEAAIATLDAVAVASTAAGK